MEACDALVVGGGPAGSTCAGELRRQGMNVILIDKAEFPRDKVCAGWITPAVADALGLDLKRYANEYVLQPISGFRTGLIGGRQQEFSYPGAVSYGVLRRQFDDYLLRRADVSLKLGEGVKSIQRRDGQWVVNDAITTPLLIGAGGHFCPVARYVGTRFSGSLTAMAAREIEFRMSPRQLDACGISAETPELFFCRDLKGYGWCLRKGTHLNIGLGREDSFGLSQHLHDFCLFLRRRGKVPADLPDGFNGYAYPLHGHEQRQIIADGLMLVGDAAGLPTAQSGGGIRTAVESALLASSAVTRAAGDYRREAFESYRDQLLQRFGEPATASTGPIFGMLRNSVGRMLLTNRWFSRHVVLDRWFLHREQHSLRPDILRSVATS